MSIYCLEINGLQTDECIRNEVGFYSLGVSTSAVGMSIRARDLSLLRQLLR